MHVGMHWNATEFGCSLNVIGTSTAYLISTILLNRTTEDPKCCREWLLFIKKQMMMLTSLLVIAISVTFVLEEAMVRLAHHISLLTGAGWVMDLLAWYPMHIHTELGVSQEISIALIEELCGMGHSNFQFVLLEEQLAIFLCASVTGFNVQHLGEMFQRSNDTISKYSNYFHIKISVL